MDDETVVPVVVAAACRLNDLVVVSARHFDLPMHSQIKAMGLTKEFRRGEQGFIDQFGQFMDRFQALEVAKNAGQLNVRRAKTPPFDRLFSEDLY